MTTLEYLNKNKWVVWLCATLILLWAGAVSIDELKEVYYETLKVSPDFIRAIRCQ